MAFFYDALSCQSFLVLKVAWIFIYIQIRSWISIYIQIRVGFPYTCRSEVGFPYTYRSDVYIYTDHMCKGRKCALTFWGAEFVQQRAGP